MTSSTILAGMMVFGIFLFLICFMARLFADLKKPFPEFYYDPVEESEALSAKNIPSPVVDHDLSERLKHVGTLIADPAAGTSYPAPPKISPEAAAQVAHKLANYAPQNLRPGHKDANKKAKLFRQALWSIVYEDYMKNGRVEFSAWPDPCPRLAKALEESGYPGWPFENPFLLCWRVISNATDFYTFTAWDPEGEINEGHQMVFPAWWCNGQSVKD